MPCCHTLHDPPQLARLSVRGLTNLNEQNIVPGIGAAFENKVRPIVRLHIDGKKLRGRMGNDDEIATDFDLKFSICHCCQAVFCKASFNDECLGGFRRFGSLGDFLVAATCLGFVGPVPQQESFKPSAPHSTNLNVHRRKVLRMVETRRAPAGAPLQAKRNPDLGSRGLSLLSGIGAEERQRHPIYHHLKLRAVAGLSLALAKARPPRREAKPGNCDGL